MSICGRFTAAQVFFISAAAAKSLQSCPTLCNPMNCSPPGSSVLWNLQARILECLAISYSRLLLLLLLSCFSSVRLCAIP